MGKRGPRPTPSSLLEERGSWRAKERVKDGEPQLAVCKQPAPEWLDDEARPYWDEISELLADIGVLTKADRWALALLCDQLVTYLAAREIVRQEGMTIETVRGMVKNPAEVQMQKAWAGIMKAAAEFGMTPSSRSGVRVVEPKDEQPGKTKASFFETG